MIPHTEEHMTEEEYRAFPAVNKSTLWEIRNSPLHYKYALEHPREDTDAFRFGRAFHMALLQPRLYSVHYAVAPHVDKRTKAGKDEWAGFVASCRADQEVLSAEDALTITSMIGSVCAQGGHRILENTSAEVPVFWTDEATGLDCKAKLDAIHVDRLNRKVTVIDLKTCTDASNRAFTRDALRYGYDVQAAHYLRGVRALYPDYETDWFFLAVEKSEPYAVNTIHAGDDFLDRGTWQLIDMMDRLKKCIDTNNWPGYGENELILPAYAVMPEESE